MRALVFGHNIGLMAAVPTLLSRAGFTVHLISDEKVMARCRNVEQFIHAKRPDAVIEIANARAKQGYDLIVPGDDRTLREILDAPLSQAEKSRLLPVVGPENWVHVSSKIGLSKVLAAHAISTPAFRIAQDSADLENAVRDFGRPVLIKNDRSGGGTGVFPCDSPDSIAAYANQIVYPVLVQEWIDGTLTDLSGFFRGGKPIFFSYAEILETRPTTYGPSVLRTYVPLEDVDAACFEEIAKLGQALGANGFANIGSLRARTDGKLYFTEADLRPIAWIEFAKFIGDDPARRIADYFQRGTILNCAGGHPRRLPDSERRNFIIPYIHRLRPEEIAANKYDCQNYRVEYFKKRPGEPLLRICLKPLAELLMTLGRACRAAPVSAAGQALWKFALPSLP